MLSEGYSAPPSLHRKAATDNMLCIIKDHPNWPVHADVFEHPPPRLASRRPIWLDMTPVDTITQWREDWSSAPVVNHTIVTDPTIRQPGFDLPRHTWSCWTVSGRVHVLQICTNGASPNHLLAIVASDRPCAILSTRAHWQNLKADWIYTTKRMMTQSYGWKPQRLQHSRNELQEKLLLVSYWLSDVSTTQSWHLLHSFDSRGISYLFY